MIYIHSGNLSKTIALMFFLILAAMVSVSCGKLDGAGSSEQQKISFVMGTAVQTTLYGKDSETGLDTSDSVLSRQDELISWRDKESLTARFNESHKAEMSQISGLVELALDVAEKSGGAFDPTILPVSKLWDIGGENERRPSEDEIQEALKHVDYRKLSYKDGILSTEDENQQIEFGAIGKGYALEQVEKALLDGRIQAGILSAGSSITAFGVKLDNSGFKVGLRDPRGGQDELIGVFTMTDLSVSTSGDYEKYFEEDGVRYHHIIDARTGYPADSKLMSVTVINENGALCDALSTAGFILGLDDGMGLMDNYGVMAIFVDIERNVYYNDEDVLELLDFQGEDKGYKLVEYH